MNIAGYAEADWLAAAEAVLLISLLPIVAAHGTRLADSSPGHRAIGAPGIAVSLVRSMIPWRMPKQGEFP